MKERLTGAIILVALVVLLVPEFLMGPSSKPATKPAGTEGAQLRSYTIDLQDDATSRPPSAPETAASDEPVGQAAAEAEASSSGDPVSAETNGSAGPASAVPRGDPEPGRPATPMGSGADGAAAATADSAAGSESGSPASGKPSSGTAASADDDRPRSAFGPNAVSRSQPEGSRQAQVPRTEAPKPEPARPASSSAAKPDVSKPTASNPAASNPEGARAERVAKGWAVQLGVFASRDNAERLAKQVKGKGYAVVVNEISGNGKRLYRVRVGPEADRAAAAALGAKLRAAGHAGSVVSYP